MADNTKIEWTDATWNPITGCSVVSPGCTNCYAMKLAGTRLRNHPSRQGLTKDSKAGPVWTGEVRFNREWLTQPLTWSKSRMIFVCAHGDLFAEGVPDEWIDQVFAVMALAPQHVFQVLTKRPERMREYFSGRRANFGRASDVLHEQISHGLSEEEHQDAVDQLDLFDSMGKPLPNVWLGVSVEDQKRADERIPILLDTPAAIRWISAEPLLGPLDLNRTLGGTLWIGGQRGCGGRHQHAGRAGDVIHGILHESDPRQLHHHHDERCNRGLDWVVAGGESGEGARPMHPKWIRELRDQCADASVPFLFKQWGNWLGGEWEDDGDRVNFTAASGHPHNVDLSQHAKVQDRIHWFEDGPDGPGALRMHKADAGRHLDGRLHDGFPKRPENFKELAR